MEKFKEALNPENYSIKFEYQSFQAMHDGYIARHIERNNPHKLVPTLRYWMNGNAKLELPLSTYGGASLKEISPMSSHVTDFLKLIKDEDLLEYRFADLNKLLLAIAIFCEQVFTLHNLDGIHGSIKCRILLNDLYGLTPYFDDSRYVEYTQANGIVILQHDSVSIPLQNKVIYLPDLGFFGQQTEGEKLDQFLHAMQVFLSVSSVFGYSMKGWTPDEIFKCFNRLLNLK